MPYVRVEQLGSHWTDFHVIWYFIIFRKSFEKFQISFRLFFENVLRNFKFHFDYSSKTSWEISNFISIIFPKRFEKFQISFRLFFENVLRNFKFHFDYFSKTFWEISNFINICQEQQALYVNTDTHFLPYLSLFFSQWKIFHTKVGEKNQNTHFVFRNILFLKSCRLWDNMEKHFRAGQAEDENMTHAYCTLDTQGHKHILRICHIYCLFTATMTYARASRLRFS